MSYLHRYVPQHQLTRKLELDFGLFGRTINVELSRSMYGRPWAFAQLSEQSIVLLQQVKSLTMSITLLGKRL
jgi:hypothetical protein